MRRERQEGERPNPARHFAIGGADPRFAPDVSRVLLDALGTGVSVRFGLIAYVQQRLSCENDFQPMTRTPFRS